VRIVKQSLLALDAVTVIHSKQRNSAVDKVTSSQIHIVIEGLNAAREGGKIIDCPYDGDAGKIWVAAFMSLNAARLHQLFPRSVVRVACMSAT
jgi:hypothetical protein